MGQYIGNDPALVLNRYSMDIVYYDDRLYKQLGVAMLETFFTRIMAGQGQKEDIRFGKLIETERVDNNNQDVQCYYRPDKENIVEQVRNSLWISSTMKTDYDLRYAFYNWEATLRG